MRPRSGTPSAAKRCISRKHADGILFTRRQSTTSAVYLRAVVSRLKIIAELDIAERRKRLSSVLLPELLSVILMPLSTAVGARSLRRQASQNVMKYA